MKLSTTRVLRVGTQAPDLLEQLAARHGFALALDERAQEADLARGERARSRAASRARSGRSAPSTSPIASGAGCRRRRDAVPAAPPQQAAHARQQLVEVEGLRQVVVRALLEAAHQVLRRRPSRSGSGSARSCPPRARGAAPRSRSSRAASGRGSRGRSRRAGPASRRAAPAPSLAISTSWPSASRLKCRPSARCASSSTTRMRAIARSRPHAAGARGAQRHDEAAAGAAALAARHDAAALAPHQVAHDEEAEAEARGGALHVAPDAVEALEDLAQLARRECRCRGPRCRRRRGRRRSRRDAHAHLDRRVRVLDRVLEQVAEHHGRARRRRRARPASTRTSSRTDVVRQRVARCAPRGCTRAAASAEPHAAAPDAPRRGSSARAAASTWSTVRSRRSRSSLHARRGTGGAAPARDRGAPACRGRAAATRAASSSRGSRRRGRRAGAGSGASRGSARPTARRAPRAPAGRRACRARAAPSRGVASPRARAAHVADHQDLPADGERQQQDREHDRRAASGIPIERRTRRPLGRRVG